MRPDPNFGSQIQKSRDYSGTHSILVDYEACCFANFELEKDKKEIDFAISQDGVITHLIETKLSDDNLSKNFSSFEKYFPESKKIQLVKNLLREYFTISSS